MPFHNNLAFKKRLKITPLQFVLYSSENIHTRPMEGQWKFRGSGGSQKPKNVKESMGLNWNNFHKGMEGG